MFRTRIIAFILLLPVGAAAWADTILLKNGRKILADEVREKGDRIEYQIGDDTYAIPKSLVDHIDTGGSPLVTRKGMVADLPAPSASCADKHVIFPPSPGVWKCVLSLIR